MVLHCGRLRLVRLDVTMRGVALRDAGAWAARAEALGVAGVWTTETNHDPFFPLVPAALGTERVQLGTGIALAFPRSPMTLAYQSWDLHAASGGRFVLGLGSQVKAHVERRFGAQYEHPARRMRELILAVRAIWDSWWDGTELAFEGEFFRHTLMPPAFRPGVLVHPRPRIFLAAVQERMTEVAGEVADGILLHPLQSEEYVRKVVLPALGRGLARAGRRREDVEVSVALFAVDSDAEREDVRRRIAFYGSTPAYRGVLEQHGWGDVGTRLWELSRTSGWDAMPDLVTDEMVETIACCGHDAAEAATVAAARYGGLADRVNIHAGERFDLDATEELVRAFVSA
jgi:probable F420-dependent oxidoreductase